MTSIFTKLTRAAAKPVLERRLKKLGEPYGVTDVDVIRFAVKPGLTLRIELEGDPVLVVADIDLTINDDGVFVKAIRADREWITKSAKPLLNTRLPIPESDLEKLSLLWPPT